jgi:hypothetical protein
VDIIMTRNTLWQNLIIRIGEEFTVSDSIGTAMIRRGVAKDKAMVAAITKQETKDAKAEQKASMKGKGDK